MLDAVARERFGPEGAPPARKAWTAFSEAFAQYPYQRSRALQLPGADGAGQSALSAKTRLPGDDGGLSLRRSGRLARPVSARGVRRAVREGGRGLADGDWPSCRPPSRSRPPNRRAENQAELRLARAADLHFQTVANQARFVMARDTLADTRHPLLAGGTPPAGRSRCGGIAGSEIALARELFTLTRQDSRIGFEPSCQYFYLPLDLVEKVINCRWILENGSP